MMALAMIIPVAIFKMISGLLVRKKIHDVEEEKEAEVAKWFSPTRNAGPTWKCY